MDYLPGRLVQHILLQYHALVDYEVDEFEEPIAIVHHFLVLQVGLPETILIVLTSFDLQHVQFHRPVLFQYHIILSVVIRVLPYRLLIILPILEYFRFKHIHSQ